MYRYLLLPMIVGASLLLPPVVQAGSPEPRERITIQGTLTDSTGAPLSGIRHVRVRFFDQSVGGSQVGANVQTVVDIPASGRFSFIVTIPDGILDVANPHYELAIDSAIPPDTVIDAGDIFPNRIPMVAVPFARRLLDDGPGSGLNADLFDNQDSTGFIKTSGGNITGMLGIGAPLAEAPLHINANNWDLGATEGDLKIGSATNRLKIGVSTGGGGAGTARIRAHGGTNRIILGSGTQDALAIQGNDAIVYGDFQYQTPKDFRLNIPPAAFMYNNSTNTRQEDTMRYHADGYMFTTEGFATHSFVVPVYLPHGATITEFKVHYYDNSVGDTAYFATSSVELRRRNVSATAAQTLASVSLNQTQDNINIQSISDTTITSPVVDARFYQYWITADLYFYSIDGDNLRFYGAEIRYTMDTVAP